jgi:DNA-binding MarR family transcriptional regulator
LQEQPLESIELELAILIRRLSSITTYNKIGSLDRAGYLLLHQISAHGSAGVKALADEFHLDISTVSRQAAALEQKGFVARVPDPSDGRAYYLQITGDGMEQLKENRHVRLALLAGLMENWSQEELSQFGELLAKFNQTVVKASPAAPAAGNA